MRESSVDSHIVLTAAQQGDYLWRNNTGAFEDPKTGRWIRYGLANESKAINSVIKSSDRIGITTIVITPEMVGQRIGVFTAIETKPTGWKFTMSDKRAVAQKAFHDIVKAAGCMAGFATCVEDYRKIVGK